MRLILQRVTSAGVTFANGAEPVKIGRGLMVLAGIKVGDNEEVAMQMAEKAANLRIFDDEKGNLNFSLLDIGGECLIVSNFTLYADCRKGRRPSFTEAMPPAEAKPLYRYLVKAFEKAGVQRVATGEFGADMQVEINNDGPVTIILD